MIPVIAYPTLLRLHTSVSDLSRRDGWLLGFFFIFFFMLILFSPLTEKGYMYQVCFPLSCKLVLFYFFRREASSLVHFFPHGREVQLAR